jgi:hypothetical protein
VGVTEINTSLREYNERRELWRRCLCGNDPNAIPNQMAHMMWNTAVWRFINECRKTAPRGSNNIIQCNGMISKFIDECYAENQLLHIRRLVDNDPIDKDPRRDVYSLVSLLDDLIKYSHLITRKNVFLSENREYDRTKAMEKFSNKITNSFESCVLAPDEDYFTIDRWHNELDFLCGVKPENRTPADSIRKCLLKNLRDRIVESSQRITLYINKHVAHSATPESRQVGQLEVLMWDDLLNTQKLIMQTVCFLNHYLFHVHVESYIPVTPSNMFEYMEMPLIHEKDSKNADKMWSLFENESKQWQKWDTDEFLKNL